MGHSSRSLPSFDLSRSFSSLHTPKAHSRTPLGLLSRASFLGNSRRMASLQLPRGDSLGYPPTTPCRCHRRTSDTAIRAERVVCRTPKTPCWHRRSYRERWNRRGVEVENGPFFSRQRGMAYGKRSGRIVASKL